MIKRDHPELSISQQCRLVRLSRSAFYYTPVGIDANTLAMMKEIDRVFTRYFRVADGYFAADHTSFWGCKIG